MTDGKEIRQASTIDDVAKLAGVSKMTVSRVVNNSGYVKQATRRRVNEAIEALKFRPNMVARGLATGRNHVIAYMMIDISDPFHNLVSQGIEAACYENGYTAMMCDIHSRERETDYLNMLTDRQIDGAVLHHLDISGETAEALERAGVRCVLLDNEHTVEGVCNVETDNYGGGYMAARHLAGRGIRASAASAALSTGSRAATPMGTPSSAGYGGTGRRAFRTV
jgi:LacI family transcriptional regulator